MVATTQLGERDIRRFSSVLGALAVPTPADEYGALVVRILPELVPARFTGWNEVDTERGSVRGVVAPSDQVPADAEAIFARHMHEHPVLSNYQRTRDGQPYKISDFLSPREFHRLALYEELYKPMGSEDQMSCVLPTGPPLVIGVALNRATRSFTERDRLMLNLARPHLVQGYRNALAYSRLLRMLDSLEDALSAHNEAVVVLGVRSTVEALSDRAARSLRSWFGWRKGQGLPDQVEEWLGEARSRRGSPGPALPLRIERNGRRLVIRLLPAAADGSGEALVLSDDPLAASHEALAALGLTGREAEVLALVAQGRSNAEVAKALALSERTVQSYLRRIYQKLGVDNRTAAASVAIDATLRPF